MQPKMLKLTMFAGVVLTAMLMAGVAQANAIYVLPGPTYSGTFILNSDGTVTPVGVGGNYTGIQQQDKLWDNFGVGNLPVGTLLTLSFAHVGSQDIHTIAYGDPFGAYGAGASFHWSYDISVLNGPPPTISDVASDIDQTRGSSTLMTTLVDNHSNTYMTNFTQNGTLTSGTTTATFLPGVDMLAVSDMLMINTNGSDVTGIANSYTQTFVPEPGTLALLGSGIVGLATILRRRINL